MECRINVYAVIKMVRKLNHDLLMFQLKSLIHTNLLLEENLTNTFNMK